MITKDAFGWSCVLRLAPLAAMGQFRTGHTQGPGPIHPRITAAQVMVMNLEESGAHGLCTGSWTSRPSSSDFWGSRKWLELSLNRPSKFCRRSIQATSQTKEEPAGECHEYQLASPKKLVFLIPTGMKQFIQFAGVNMYVGENMF